ncbi:MAG: hypothetical protein JOZ97_00460, partial [Candidatus Eremiobacteraeota bacterium]|nr:hypothetical protein [Candidatus Eremiobacteraeota bacterium]
MTRVAFPFLLVAFVLIAAGMPTAATSNARMWHGCQIGVPERDYYDTDVTHAPIDPNSRVRIASVVAAMVAQHQLHAPDSPVPSQGFTDDRGLYPINIATASTPAVRVIQAVAWHRHLPSPVPYSRA